MKENVGGADRIARSILGPGLIISGIVALRGARARTAGVLSVALGAILLETAVSRVCPLNQLLGFDTRSQQQRLRDQTASAVSDPGTTPHVRVAHG